MYSYSYSDLAKFSWLAKTLKDSPNETPLRIYQRWKNAIYEDAFRKSDQMHQTFEKISLAMTCKLDDMIKLPKLHPKRTYKEDLECEIIRVKIPKCMSWLEPIGDLDMMKDKMIEDDWELELKEVSFLGRGLNLPVRPKEVKKVRIKDLHHLEHIFQQVFQHMAPFHHNVGWLLEEIHVTWTQFGKKRDKIATLYEEAQKMHTECEDGVRISSDAVRILVTASELPPSSSSKIVCKKEKDSDVMLIELIKKYDDSSAEELEEDDNVEGEEELGVDYFDKFPTRSELAYQKTYDSSLGIVKFTNGADEITYKMPHKIDQLTLLSDMEKEHTQSVYFRNEEEKRRGVNYVMNKILGFYKECLELGPKYLTGLERSSSSDNASEEGVT
ncbi:hypothetical protein Tco_1053496 [Tanacetum coccineum]|uniref:Uncharacterized protein n=1 Tax=Tanacetum coccineum TaxID=301880 RepID=A0ABQ5GV35_9ASTR